LLLSVWLAAAVMSATEIAQQFQFLLTPTTTTTTTSATTSTIINQIQSPITHLRRLVVCCACLLLVSFRLWLAADAAEGFKVFALSVCV